MTIADFQAFRNCPRDVERLMVEGLASAEPGSLSIVVFIPNTYFSLDLMVFMTSSSVKFYYYYLYSKTASTIVAGYPSLHLVN